MGGLTAFGASALAPPLLTNSLDIRIIEQGRQDRIELFDQRGSHYGTLARPNGSRGSYGEERREFFLAADAAASSFQPGPLEPSRSPTTPARTSC